MSSLQLPVGVALDERVVLGGGRGRLAAVERRDAQRRVPRHRRMVPAHVGEVGARELTRGAA